MSLSETDAVAPASLAAAATSRLSALVVARNEEVQLRECLAGLTFADEIVVVLDRCEDRSRSKSASSSPARRRLGI
jgi:hypothetical protein